MLAMEMPRDTSEAVKMFLVGWSMCMNSMTMMTEKDKKFLEKIFKEVIEPNADCPEMRALDAAFRVYLNHKCGSPDGIGSAVPRADA